MRKMIGNFIEKKNCKKKANQWKVQKSNIFISYGDGVI